MSTEQAKQSLKRAESALAFVDEMGGVAGSGMPIQALGYLAEALAHCTYAQAVALTRLANDVEKYAPTEKSVDDLVEAVKDVARGMVSNG